MGKAIIVQGEGYSRDKVAALMNIIASQLTASQKIPMLDEMRLPRIKRRFGSSFNKTKENERRRKQIERRNHDPR